MVLEMSNRDMVLIPQSLSLKISHWAQFSVKDCSVGDGRRWKSPCVYDGGGFQDEGCPRTPTHAGHRHTP